MDKIDTLVRTKILFSGITPTNREVMILSNKIRDFIFFEVEKYINLKRKQEEEDGA